MVIIMSIKIDADHCSSSLDECISKDLSTNHYSVFKQSDISLFYSVLGPGFSHILQLEKSLVSVIFILALDFVHSYSWHLV
jgi:hypothetical protein